MPIHTQLINELKKGLRTSSTSKQAPPTNTLKKRHWLLSSLVIVTGSWITHTTTATISQDSLVAPQQGQVSDLGVDANVPGKQPTLDANSTSAMAPISKAPISASSTVTALEFSESVAVVSDSVEKVNSENQQPFRVESYTVKKGESLGYIFKKNKFDLAIPHYVSRHPIAKQLTSIRPGKTLEFHFNSTGQMTGINYPLNALERLTVELDGTTVREATVSDIEFDTVQRTVSADIRSSLYLAGQNAGLSNNLIMEMVRIFGWDIDFVQDIRVGDQFHVVFDEHQKDGEKLSDGNILAAEFTTQGHTYRAFRFEDEDGRPSYFTENGESMLGTFLRSPVEFSRISSRFGKRKHPISKKWKAHKGVDYAASRGTPIRATADGKVISAGRNGGYGKTVVLRHAGRFTTLYAHMNGYAKGIKSGSRVKQGQTIGYVGTTGLSTGPHLHYEFRLDGVHRNPLTYKTPKASSVSEKNKAKFKQVSTSYIAKLDSLSSAHQLAKTQTPNSKETKSL